MSNKDLLMNLSFEEVMAEVDSMPTLKQSYSNRKNTVDRKDSYLEFSIIQNFGKLSNRKNAATFAIVDWRGYKRYDLRAWNEDYTVPFKGLSFDNSEISVLFEALSNYTPQTYRTPLHTIDMGKTKANVYHTVCELSSSTLKEVLWTKLVTVVDWGYGQKYDFRKWTENFERCSKGICLTQEELDALVEILETLDF